MSLLTQALLREAQDRGDVVAQLGLRTGRCNFAWLLINRPDEAQAHIAAAEQLGDQARALGVGLHPAGDRIFEIMGYIEKRMGQLPGMDGLDCCTLWATRVQPMLPPETRASSIPLELSAAA